LQNIAAGFHPGNSHIWPLDKGCKVYQHRENLDSHLPLLHDRKDDLILIPVGFP
jgi:hypothetical protein